MITDINKLYLLILLWVIAILLISLNRLKKNFSGLSMMFVTSMSILYFAGAITYALPWNYLKGFEATLLGFEQATIGIISFTFANLLISPIFVKKFISQKTDTNFKLGNSKNVTYLSITIGLLSLFGFLNFMLFIPTLRAFLIALNAVFVGGLCLYAWESFLERDKLKLGLVIIFSLMFPIITVINSGFLSKGMTFTLIVLIFTYRLWVPRWQFLLITIICLYMGFGFYQTYRRERDDIREVVWGGYSLGERIDVFKPIILEYEFFNPFNSEHISNIDDRLNLNNLTGLAVENLEHRNELLKGDSFKNIIYAIVPRIIWKNKPYVAGSDDLVTKYTGVEFGDNTSVGMGYVMEFYINYGTIAVILGFFFLGFLIFLLDFQAGKSILSSNYQNFLLYFMPGLTLLSVGTNMIETTVSAVSAFVIVFAIFKIPAGKLGSLFLIGGFFVTTYIVLKVYFPLINPIVSGLKYVLFLLVVSFLVYIFAINKKKSS